MSQNIDISRNFSMVSEGTRRGSGIHKDKNIPEPSGNMTISVPLDFLYKQLEKMQSNKKKAMLLSVFKAIGGEVDPLKKRLITYGLFSKQIQVNPNKFRDEQVENFFVWGQNITSFEIRKLKIYMATICNKLGDEKATHLNFKRSKKFDEAMKVAKNINILVVGRYEDMYVGVSETDETMGYINLAYVKFGSGKTPLISSFDRPMKDGLIELEMNGEKVRDYVLDPDGSISMVTSRGFLKNFNSSEESRQNLKLLTVKKDNKKFWNLQVSSYKTEDLPTSFFASFSGETLELLQSSDRISFEYSLKDTDKKLIDEILKCGTDFDDAKLVFTGLIRDEDKKINIYITEEDDEGKTKKYVTFRILRGTFFTQKIL